LRDFTPPPHADRVKSPDDHAPDATETPADLAELDVSNYRRGSKDAGRCADCSYSQMVWERGIGGEEGQGCRLYDFSTLSGGGYKPFFVCDDFERGMRWAEGKFRFRDMPLVQVGDREDDGSVWNEVLLVGVATSREVGGTAASGQERVDITEEWIDSLVRGTEQVLEEGWFPGGIPFRDDAGHGDKSKPAVGRVLEIKKAYAEDGTPRALIRVNWTDPDFADAVDKQHVSGCSVEMDFGLQSKKGKGRIDDWAMTAVVPTNYPFIPGMDALAASEAGEQEKDMKTIAVALNLAEDSAESALLAEIERLRDQADKVETLEENARALAEERDGLQAKLDKHEADERTRRIEQACVDGRIDAGEKERYGRALDALSAEDLEAFFPTGRKKTEPRTVETTDDNGDPEAAKLAALNERAGAIAKERGIEMSAAFSQARRELNDTTKEG